MALCRPIAGAVLPTEREIVSDHKFLESSDFCAQADITLIHSAGVTTVALLLTSRLMNDMDIAKRDDHLALWSLLLDGGVGGGCGELSSDAKMILA
jgi:hypothetical protein